ncbi:uncharacterized protein LOC119388083 [Rhipicephalus sanguineus]|uniref:uncharacterized protein LOC119388083 n=1 Tax=Rhipicephalus sanguineus TaxID=34632 RepID=UPI001894AAC0|nr:uncharacterized protein LOC119388083 [Rhipicephalus sanguineus]
MPRATAGTGRTTKCRGAVKTSKKKCRALPEQDLLEAPARKECKMELTITSAAPVVYMFSDAGIGALHSVTARAWSHKHTVVTPKCIQPPAKRLALRNVPGVKFVLEPTATSKQFIMCLVKGTALEVLSRIKSAAQLINDRHVIKWVKLRSSKILLTYIKQSKSGAPASDNVPGADSASAAPGGCTSGGASGGQQVDHELNVDDDVCDLGDTSEWISVNGETCVLTKLPKSFNEEQ